MGEEYSRHISLPQKCLLTIRIALHWCHHTAPQVNRSQGIFTLEERGTTESPAYTVWTCLTLLLQTSHRLSQAHVRWEHRGWQKILFKMSTPYKLHEKMQASLEMRSGGKKWRVGDAQVALSHWRTAWSRPWHSMSVLTGVSHGTPCVCSTKPQSQQLTRASFVFRVRSFCWGNSLLVSQQPELLNLEGLSRCPGIWIIYSCMLNHVYGLGQNELLQ